MAGIPSGQIHEPGAVDLRGEPGIVGVLAAQHPQRDRLHSHRPVVGGAQGDPVGEPVLALERGGGGQEDGALGAALEQLGVDRTHHRQELAAAHEGDGSRRPPRAHRSPPALHSAIADHPRSGNPAASATRHEAPF